MVQGPQAAGKALDDIQLPLSWPDGWSGEIQRLRSRATVAIRRCGKRTHIVLRSVDGDPVVLIEFLQELHAAAEDAGKQLWVHQATSELRQLAARFRSDVRFVLPKAQAGDPKAAASAESDLAAVPKSGPSGASKAVPDAGNDAAEALDKLLKRSIADDFEMPELPNLDKPSKPKRKKKDLLILGAVILGVTLIIGAVQAYIVFNDQPQALQVEGMIKSLEAPDGNLIQLELENERLRKQIAKLKKEKDELLSTIRVLRNLPEE